VSFLTFFPEGAPEVYAPSRVYARLDRLEPPPEDWHEGVTAVLDSVDADWFDRGGREQATLADPSFAGDVERRVSMLEVPFDRDTVRRELILGDEDPWFELLLSDSGGGRTVLHFLNLFGPPIERSLESMERTRGDIEHDLNRTTSLDAFPDADADDISALLAGIGEPEAAAVYDVGQGGCNALLNDRMPTVYFDFGGGVRNNAPSYPARLRRFCFTNAPPIVLSHWDDDHWSSAGRDTRAYAATWLVPKQKLGVSHNAHIAKIGAAGGALLYWPAGLPSATAGALTVEKCAGSPKSRNNSGLALVVEGPDERAGERMLFPADARYEDVPSSGLDFTHLVAAHHGGLTRSHIVPRSDGRACGRLVYTYGRPNRNRHPIGSVVTAHAAVWATDLRTENRGPSGLGHVHLYWDDTDPNADPLCWTGRGGATGMCDLTCQQR
jgi:hypothetical protein